MLRLYGIPMRDAVVRSIVVELLNDGAPDALVAARSIDAGIQRGTGLVAISPIERNAVLRVLRDAEEGAAGLRAALERDSEFRNGPIA